MPRVNIGQFFNTRLLPHKGSITKAMLIDHPCANIVQKKCQAAGDTREDPQKLGRIEGKVDEILTRLETVGGSGSPAVEKKYVQSAIPMCQTPPPQLVEGSKIRFASVLHNMLAVTSIASFLFDMV